MNFLGLLPENDVIPPYDIGPEKQCPRCKEYWPIDEEFFSPKTDRNKVRLQSWCRACSTENSTERNNRRKQQRKELLKRDHFSGGVLGLAYTHQGHPSGLTQPYRGIDLGHKQATGQPQNGSRDGV